MERKKIASIVSKMIFLISNFGVKILLLDLLRKLPFHNDENNKNRIQKLYSDSLLLKLNDKFKYFINGYDVKEVDTPISDSSNIWIFWWQGTQQMPDIVSTCVNSIINNSGKHKVILLTKENVRTYCSVPSHIYEKVQNGTLSITNFSDILRFNLLKIHGGIWVDATLFATKKFDDELSQYSFYSIHHNQYCDTHICRGKWSTFFMASGQNGIVVSFVNDFLQEYCLRYDFFVTYLLIDYILNLGYINIPAVKKCIDDIPVNNPNVFNLEPILNDSYDNSVLSKLEEDTKLFKLTYKNEHSRLNGTNDTFYERISSN